MGAGFVFSVLDIRAVRGELDSTMQPERHLHLGSLEALPEALRTALSNSVSGPIIGLELIDRGLGPHWEARDGEGALLARMDLDGRPAGLITSEQAAEVAKRDFVHDTSVLAVDLIESGPPTEYRGRPLPAYRVELEHAKDPHIYVDARTGAITARRNRSWRTFDFFWMLHTMDYRGRDDFNHPLLTIASLLAIATSGTGLTLWAWRVLPIRRRKKPSVSAAG